MSIFFNSRAFAAAAIAIAVATTGAMVPGEAFSADDPIKVRRAAMKQMGGHMKGIGGFLKGGRRAGTADTVALRAESIGAIAARIPALFPKGTGMDMNAGKTGAKPVIWTDWAAFQKAAKTLQAEAAKMAAAAGTGDKNAIKAAMGKLGKVGCGGCHRTFRQKLKKK